MNARANRFAQAAGRSNGEPTCWLTKCRWIKWELALPVSLIDSNRTWRLGVVSYLNAKPLVHNLGRDPRIELTHDVPARLPALLDAGKVDAALVPVIDLAKEGRSWQVVSDACIGCHGESLTVRVFSRIAPESIRTLHVDGDSHTSVALARIIWRERFSQCLEVVPYRGNESVEECEAILLIGDKVVRAALTAYEIETDLGCLWKSLTALPFVFAVWAAPTLLDAGPLATRLREARDIGVGSAEDIAARYAPAMGWPVALATQYLTRHLEYTLGPQQRLGLARFLELARTNRILSTTHKLVFA